MRQQSMGFTAVAREEDCTVAVEGVVIRHNLALELTKHHHQRVIIRNSKEESLR
jgi:hypothetical protein